MKKLISAVSAAILTVSSVMPFVSSAEEEYIPLFYMKMQENENITIEADGTVVISREAAENGLLLNAGIFIQDDTQTAWSVSPKWKSSSSFINLEHAYNPLPTDDSPLLPYAYAETDSNGNLKRGVNSTDLSVNSQYDSINFTCRRTDGKPMAVYGSATDDYPLISFDMSVNKNIPYGEYKIYFLTEQDNSCRIAMAIEGRPIYSPPRIENLRIRVEGANSGDVNNDGSIDASDASAALAAYAEFSTGGVSSLTPEETYAADVNNDGAIDSTDASDILLYYAYASTTNEEIKSLKEYFGR